MFLQFATLCNVTNELIVNIHSSSCLFYLYGSLSLNKDFFPGEIAIIRFALKISSVNCYYMQLTVALTSMFSFFV